jgi:hypothetical protein
MKAVRARVSSGNPGAVRAGRGFERVDPGCGLGEVTGPNRDGFDTWQAGGHQPALGRFPSKHGWLSRKQERFRSGIGLLQKVTDAGIWVPVRERRPSRACRQAGRSYGPVRRLGGAASVVLRAAGSWPAWLTRPGPTRRCWTGRDSEIHPRRRTISSVSAGTTLNRSPTMPKSARSKIGASGSLLTAAMTLDVCMPARCWIAPEMPIAR